MLTGQPVLILKEGTEATKGRDAHSSNIAAARAVADAVKSTLGPKGMDKMLVDGLGDIVITNDGVTILKELDIEHPAAKMILEIAKTQDDECGDGTTSAVVIAGELLKKSEQLLEQRVHPTILANGFRLASARAIKILSDISFEINIEKSDMVKKIALTAMTGKSVDIHNREKLADIAERAVRQITKKSNGGLKADVEDIIVEKKQGGSIADTELVFGIILDKERVNPMMVKVITNAKIALINRALEIKKTEVDAKIQIRDPAQLQKFLREEEKTLRALADKIKASGANVVICEKGIDDLVQHYLTNDGIFALRRVKKEDMEKIAKATGATHITNLDDLKSDLLGKATTVEERKIADSDMTFITGCKNPKAVSILIRGGTEHVITEIERALHDALKVVSVVIEDGKAVVGGGAAEIETTIKLKNYAATVGGREQLAIELFAEALEIIPITLAENAGMDTIDTLIALKNQHESKKKNSMNFGVDVHQNKVVDMRSQNVIEPLRVKTQAIASAAEVATMILRIDDMIAAKKGAPSGGGAPGGAGGMGSMPGMM